MLDFAQKCFILTNFSDCESEALMQVENKQNVPVPAESWMCWDLVEDKHCRKSPTTKLIFTMDQIKHSQLELSGRQDKFGLQVSGTSWI